MSTHIDFFELKTTKDLFRKLEGDFAALKESQDTRIAFNFFVTAEHLPDWLNRRDLVQKEPILRIVSHIANGAKHFTLNDSRHKSVTHTEKLRYFEEGYIEPGYIDEPLIIHLSTKEAHELSRNSIDATELARRVLEFWKPFI